MYDQTGTPRIKLKLHTFKRVWLHYLKNLKFFKVVSKLFILNFSS